MTVLSTILKACAEYVHIDRDAFMASVQEVEDARQQTELAQYADRLKAAQARANELEKLICRIYEDHVLEKIPDERYEALDSQYTKTSLHRRFGNYSFC